MIIIIMLGIVATTRLHVSQYCGVVRMHRCTTVNILTNIISMASMGTHSRLGGVWCSVNLYI